MEILSQILQECIRKKSLRESRTRLLRKCSCIFSEIPSKISSGDRSKFYNLFFRKFFNSCHTPQIIKKRKFSTDYSRFKFLTSIDFPSSSDMEIIHGISSEFPPLDLLDNLSQIPSEISPVII